MTAPLSELGHNVLKELFVSPTPAQEINPGLARKLVGEGYAERVMLPSPYPTHKGKKIEFLAITMRGRAMTYRGTGRTKDMVKGLPRDGRCVVIVHTDAMRSHLRDMIREELGVDAFRVNILVFETVDDIMRLRGYELPVFVDHAVWELAPPRMCLELGMLLETLARRRKGGQ